MTMREFLNECLNNSKLLAIAGAVVGAVLGSALPLLLLMGSVETIGIAPVIVFGLMGAVGGAAYGTVIASGLGEAESGNDQMAERADAHPFSEIRETDTRTIAQPLPRPYRSFQEMIALSHQSTNKGRE